ncbi:MULTISPECIES: PaaI family thioesterase [Lysinibacillus]|uniref:Medium/long-chain acyl-CoA thioesterase YigI n=2 Tax=Lysinibacillus capsici TaxID=2115968 RepID=A0ABY8KJB2_9BACI|nr:PaaI family thioesterase [Lysinibacillus capsici]MCT1540982.1 PaaI family thioesterase [Lysinibacillus capsici]MCT1572256.1 PaaI family thioesterase [Lysinibacillus capsici]MCT1649421.1 PaaI family thioesterase [Lysinibacillus capsici]MCT1727900.1 PaaI family thioesterase [Lysinibacillus capsici]MCT1785582.1 PaaI family thioesterase [Lysinibacillus capsici]
MMTTSKEQVEQLVAEILQDSTEEDEEVLLHLLNGLREKQQGIHRRYINATLHMVGKFEPEVSEVRIPITPVIHNTIKVPHGGIVATIADAAMGGLASRYVPEGYNVVTTNMNISYIATTTNKELIARGRFVHKGRQTLVMECDIEDETGRRLAIATGSFFVIQRRP